MVRFGVKIHQEGLDFATIKGLCQESERLGLESFWIMDHIHALLPPPQRPSLECWTLLTALAVSTRKIRLGTLVMCNSYRHPPMLAKMASTLDVISDGRLILGLGAGWHEPEYTGYGFPFPKAAVRIQQLREGIKILKKMFTEEKTNFEGKHYTLRDAENYPKPVQKPHPPIWIGGGGEKLMLRVVAELADGWNWVNLSPEEFKHKVEVLEKYCSEFGRDPSEIVKSYQITVFTAEKAEESNRRFDRFHRSHPLKSIREMPREELIRKQVVGPPDKVIESINEYVKAGANYIIFAFPEEGRLRESLHLCAERVLPAFREG